MSWSTAPTLPQRKHGPAWSTAPAAPARQIGTGWFNASAEKVAALSGHGTLSATIVSKRTVTAAFSARGTLTAVVTPKYALTGEFDSTGTLIADVVILRSITVNFSAGSDGLVVAVNEGLTAIIEGGATPVEGLSATVISGGAPGAVTVGLGATSTLSATVIQAHTSAAVFTGSGVLLAATFTQSYPVPAALSATGTLSATVAPRHAIAATFTSSGALAAVGTQQYGIAAQFGDISGGVTVAAALAGSGVLSATVVTGEEPSVGISDDFNRADSTTSLGSDWTNRLDVLGIIGNAASLTSSSGGGWNIASHNTPLESDDMEASVILGGSNTGTMLGLGFSEGGEGAFTYVPGDGNYYFYQQTNWSSWSYVEIGFGTPHTTGDKLTIRRVGNVYSVLLNDVQQATWTDGADNIPRDSDHRLVDIGIYSSGTYDSFEAQAL